MVVHLPIALLSAAVAVDFLALLIRPWRWLRPAAVTMYVLGATGAIAAYFTGQAAADSVTLPAQAQTVLTDHANLAWWTMWGSSLYALVRLATILYEKTRRSLALHGLLFAVGLAGMYLPWQTGEHGAQMVFEYGVGVQAVDVENPVQHEHNNGHGAGEGASSDSTATGNGGMRVSKSDSWQWQPAAGAAEALSTDTFHWLAGEPSALDPQVREGRGAGGPALALRSERGQPVMFTAGEPLWSIQTEARLDLSGFEGTATLVHHVRDAQNYDFVALESSDPGEGGTMRLGRVRGGERSVSAEGTYEQGGWLDLRVVSDASHYRGYIGGEMIAHGHADAPQPGRVGLRLEGSGPVLLAGMNVQRLR